jgi:hypothetical protein
MAGSVGIFWGIPDSNRSWTLLIDATPFAEAEPYGDFLTHPRGHYDVWNNWQELNAAALWNGVICFDQTVHRGVARF